MDVIFHEKQDGQLCAQHCLNTLLQGPYYTAVDLANLAAQLDDEERNRMAEAEGSEEYRRFLEQPSSNMDDTGFFSVQVIAKAIAVWGLDLVSFTSSDAIAVAARQNPVTQTAFICNYREHWFTIRRLATQWFNLNSLLTGPELISNTFVGLFLAQLQTEGYTIYVVTGQLPDCEADQLLRLVPAVQERPPQLISEAATAGRAATSAAAVASSSSRPPQQPDAENVEDVELQRAMAMSLEAEGSDTTGAILGDEEMEMAMRLSRSMGAEAAVPPSHLSSEEDDIQKAIQLSLQDSAPKAKKAEPKPSPVPSTSQTSTVATQKKTTAPKPATTTMDKPKVPSPKKPTSSPSATTTTSTTSTMRSPVSSTPSASTSTATMSGPGQSLGGQTQGQRQSTPDPEEVRRRRLAYLDSMQKKQ